MDKFCKIRDIQRSIIAFEQEIEKQYGISLNEGMTLCSLKKSHSLSCGEISELLGLTSSNTSKVLSSVEKKELVERMLGKEDKRQMYFTLTDKGRNLINSIKCEDIKMNELLENIIG